MTKNKSKKRTVRRVVPVAEAPNPSKGFAGIDTSTWLMIGAGAVAAYWLATQFGPNGSVKDATGNKVAQSWLDMLTGAVPPVPVAEPAQVQAGMGNVPSVYKNNPLATNLPSRQVPVQRVQPPAALPVPVAAPAPQANLNPGHANRVRMGAGINRSGDRKYVN